MGILETIELIKIPSSKLSLEKITPVGNKITPLIFDRQLGQVFDDIFRNYLIYINNRAQKKIVASSFYRGHKIEKFKPSKENIKNHIQKKFRKNSESVDNETEIIYNIIHSIDYSKFIAPDIIYIDLFLGKKEFRMVDKFGFRNPHYLLKPDIVVNKTIIDIKFTDKITFTPEYFYQLLLYYIWLEYLKKNNTNNTSVPNLEISSLAIFYPKTDLLYSIKINDVIPDKVMKPFMDFWFSLIKDNYPFLRKFLPLLFAFKNDPNFYIRKRSADQFTLKYLMPQLKHFSSKLERGVELPSDLVKIVVGLLTEILEVKYRTIKYSIKPSYFFLDNDIQTLGCLNYLKCNFNAHSKYLESKIDSVADKLIFLVENKIKDNTLKDLIVASGLEYSELQKTNKENYQINLDYFNTIMTDLKKFIKDVGVDGRCKYYLTDKREIFGQHYFNSWPYLGDKIIIQTKDKSNISINPEDIKKIEVFDHKNKIIRTYPKLQHMA